MALRDKSDPLVRLDGSASGGSPWPTVVKDYPVPDPRLQFKPANRQAGWRTAQRLQEQQRRLQASKGARQ